MLSFLGYADEVTQLLNLLNVNSQNYTIVHRDMMLGFVLERPRQTPSDAVLFGQKQLHQESIWPCHERLQRLGRYKEMKIASIRYKCLHDCYELTAI